MFLGRTRCAAHTITARTAANKVTITGSFTDDGITRCRADYSADLHPLGYKTVVIIFFYKTCSKANLVAIGTIASSGALGDFTLWQFPNKGLIIRRTWVT